MRLDVYVYGEPGAWIITAKKGKNMLSDTIFNKTRRPVMGAAMDAAMLRSRVLANNIANVTTPGFQRVDVKFEDELRAALDKTRLQGTRTNSNHLNIGRLNLSEVGPKAYKPYDPTQPSGVNNVDIDIEMAKLAETQISFQYLNKFNQGVFKKLNAAIKGQSLQS
ncbi:MAG: flagellar basal body rod protein FlgB [Chitinispirillales bacterium]|nr:flagellar basal body rod protein FlgB [Chitinispirillales bacterium]